MKNFYAMLDQQVFPRVIAYTTHHLHITGLMVLWLCLLLCGSFTAFELVGGNYTNGLSALAGCIIMLLQNRHHKEQMAHHEAHAARLDAIEQRLQRKPQRSADGRFTKE